VKEFGDGIDKEVLKELRVNVTWSEGQKLHKLFEIWWKILWVFFNILLSRFSYLSGMVCFKIHCRISKEASSFSMLLSS
jgi:hypothetical protein